VGKTKYKKSAPFFDLGLLVFSILSAVFCDFCSESGGGFGLIWAVPGLFFFVIQGYKMRTIGKKRSAAFRLIYGLSLALAIICFLFWGVFVLLLLNLPKDTII
jgi:hypothetical protein